jgi:hypothetical protein
MLRIQAQKRKKVIMKEALSKEEEELFFNTKV